MLEFKSITKRFGNITALQDVTFEVDEGDFVFITGPSGSGKTTLLRLILREFKPDGGKLILNGRDISELPDKEIPKLRQQIGVVFQDFKVLPERTVRENVEVALAVIGLPRDEWKARVDHVMDLVDMRKRSEFFPSQLAGGEIQRVSLARALVVNPKIILADEPTGNLDWETADKLMDLFEKINEEGKTIIMATHHKGIIDHMSKKTVVLKDGKVVSGGGIKEMEVVGEDSELPDKENKEKDQSKKTKKR
jgi:cell division transport system ATP-binding protein